MNARSITPARLLGCALFTCLMYSCSAPAYSPSLGLGVDNLPHRNTRLGVSIESAPNALSAREGGPKLSRSVSLRYERGITNNFAMRAKLFFAQSVDEDKPAYEGTGMGVGFESVVRKVLSARTDLVFVPRIQIVYGGLLFGGGGSGAGLSTLLRRRLCPNLALYGGLAAYFGNAASTKTSTSNGEFITPGGRALGGHFGLSYNTDAKTNFNLEISPLSQHDNFFKRSVLVPVVQLAFSREITGYSREERRTRRETRREIQRMKKSR